MSELLTQAEEEKIHAPGDKWSDTFALSIAKRDFNAAAAYRAAHHDQRWMNADLIYLAWVQKRNWEGTRIPRASIPIFLAFEQIEALIPRIQKEIFGDPSWFDAVPYPGTDPAEARAAHQLMLAQGDAMRIKAHYRRAFKSALIYGNGITELVWENSEVTTPRWIREEAPITHPISHPLFGVMQVPIGRKFNVVKKDVTKKVNRPLVQYRSIKDFYIDPNCPSPNVKDAAFTCIRSYKTIEEVKSWRGKPGMRIPGDERLLELARNKPSAQADVTKAGLEAGRGGFWNPNTDQSADPASKRIEVIAYWRPERLVWMANQEEILYNDVNPWGFIPQYNCFYTDVLDRFYALAVTDVVEGEQKLQEGIINARLDELALAIHTPAVKRRGVAVNPYQMRRRPDQVIEADNPRDDVQLLEVKPQAQEAYIEVNASDVRAQRITGASELAVLGTGSSGGNSANRTAAGINTQAGAASSRITGIVENIETVMIEPQLEDWHTMNTMMLNPEEAVEVLGPMGEAIQLDPTLIKNAHVKFSMRASGRMKSKSAMLQIFPQVMQTFLNPTFLDMLAKQQNKTVDINELTHMLLDAVDYPSRTAFFRDLTPEEVQALNQPPAEVTSEREMHAERMQTQSTIAEMKQDTELMKEVIKGGVKMMEPKPKKKEDGGKSK